MQLISKFGNHPSDDDESVLREVTVVLVKAKSKVQHLFAVSHAKQRSQLEVVELLELEPTVTTTVTATESSSLRADSLLPCHSCEDVAAAANEEPATAHPTAIAPILRCCHEERLGVENIRSEDFLVVALPPWRVATKGPKIVSGNLPKVPNADEIEENRCAGASSLEEI